jgi:hypothetical protein
MIAATLFEGASPFDSALADALIHRALFTTLAAPAFPDPAAGSQLFIATPASLESLISQVGRSPTPSLTFPPSGGSGSGGGKVIEEMTLLPSPPVTTEEIAQAEPLPEPVWMS